MSNYKEITYDEAQALVMSEVPNGWMHPDMPRRQYESVVEKELAAWEAGQVVAPYQALVSLLNLHPIAGVPKLLDVGASSGYYSAVLKARGFRCEYYGLDISPHYREFAFNKFPGLISDWIIADAADIPLPESCFDIVITGGTIMHSLNYETIIDECKRVARHQVVFHRTPVHSGPVQYFTKIAYGLPCLEVHFNVSEIEELFEQDGWRIVASERVSWNMMDDSGHISYLLERA